MMASGQYGSPGDTHAYLLSSDMAPALYDGTSCESSASSPMNYNPAYDGSYTSNHYLPYNGFTAQYPMHHEDQAPPGLIPVELDIEGLYEDHDRRRKRGSEGKVVAPHVHSRRRAQNRASQRAFRDRKEKHMKELEVKLEELEGQHQDLTKSHQSLQQEYATVKSELEVLRKDNMRLEKEQRDSDRNQREWELSRGAACDPVFFDNTNFWPDHDGERKQ